MASFFSSSSFSSLHSQDFCIDLFIYKDTENFVTVYIERVRKKENNTTDIRKAGNCMCVFI